VLDKYRKDKCPPRYDNENPDAYYARRDLFYENSRKRLVEKEEELLIKNNNHRYKILEFPISSKMVKKFIKTKKVNELFINTDSNRELLLDYCNRYDGTFYGRKEDNILIALKDRNFKEYPFIITNGKYYFSSFNYLNESKKNINENTIEYLNDNNILHCNIQRKLWKNNYDKIIEF